MNEIEKLLQALAQMGERYGPFQGLTVTANATCRAVWAQRTEEFTLRELLFVTNQLPPIPVWQVKLGQALHHTSRREHAEARALELEVMDLLLAEAKAKTQKL